ncbi:hypothetical protein LCGC14_2681200, partial [marine sediment metagenome]
SREGQVWEACDFVIDHKLNNVTLIFNCNGQGQSDYVSVQQQAGTLAKKLRVKVTTRARPFAVTADAECKTFALAPEGATDNVIGRGVLVDVALANNSDADVLGVAALAPMTMQRMNPGVWPTRVRGRDAVQPSYGGHYRAIGKYRKPANAYNMALFVFEGPRPAMDRLSANAAGYNFGLVAIKRNVTVKARSAGSLPLLFLRLDRPEKVKSLDPIAVINAVRPALMGKLKDQK